MPKAKKPRYGLIGEAVAHVGVTGWGPVERDEEDGDVIGASRRFYCRSMPLVTEQCRWVPPGEALGTQDGEDIPLGGPFGSASTGVDPAGPTGSGVLNLHGAWNVSVYLCEELCLWDGLYVLLSPPQSLKSELAAIMGLAHVVGSAALQEDLGRMLRTAHPRGERDAAVGDWPLPVPEIMRVEDDAAQDQGVLRGSLRHSLPLYLALHPAQRGGRLPALGEVCLLRRDGSVLMEDLRGAPVDLDSVVSRPTPKEGSGGE